jgi:hypothetical protein
MYTIFSAVQQMKSGAVYYKSGSPLCVIVMVIINANVHCIFSYHKRYFLINFYCKSSVDLSQNVLISHHSPRNAK